MPGVGLPANQMKTRSFSGFVGDPYSNSKIILQFSGGEQCVSHQIQHATLTILCNREGSSPFEVREVQEISPCETAIIAASPVVCTLSPKPKEPEKKEDTQDRMEILLEIEDQIAELRNRVLVLEEQLH